VVGEADRGRGQVVKAFVILTDIAKSHYSSVKQRDELTIELQNHVKKITAPYKYPRKIEYVTTLPKTVSGKIRRVELRNRQRQRE